MVPTKINFKIYQGSTFNEVIRYESYIKIYRTITGINKTAPLVVTATGHSMVAGWRCKLSNVVGMTEVNSLGYITNSSVTTDTATFNSINAAGYKDYVSGGILEYNMPVNLTGLTARMQIRPKITSTTIIDELTTANNGIVLDDNAKTISINISAEDTELYTFKSAVYSLEIIDGTTVTTLAYGNLSLIIENTR